MVEEYKATLDELTSNSKVEINVLTMLAEDNKEFAVHIAACIENQLKSVPSRRKLPVLYLIDSICKNFPQSIYVQLFTQNIVSNFCNVFEVSDEKVRKSLHKLRMTWNATKIFPQKKLNAIDERVHDMDPNWPILHQIPSESSQPTKRTKYSHGPKLVAKHNTPPSEQVLIPPPQPFIDPSIIQTPSEIPIILPTATFIDPNLIIASSEPLLSAPQIFIPHPPPQAQPPPPPQPSSQEMPIPPQENQPAHLAILESLYGGKQCSNCSLRFHDSRKYAIHLDWHFRHNQISDKLFTRRKWYYPLDLWVQFREMDDEEDNSNNNLDDLLVQNEEVPTAPASKNDEKNICSVCHESFEKFWAEEEEEWRLRNAKICDDERVYHPLCLMDMSINK